MKRPNLLLAIAATLAMAPAAGHAQATREKTTFQTGSHWKPATDIRADVVMCYGANDRKDETFLDRVNSWRKRG